MKVSMERFRRLADSWQDATRRYERKFLLEGAERWLAETTLAFHPAHFSEIFHRRWVNNIYLDTQRLDSYRDNLSGFSEHRVKARIRWYGRLAGELLEPALELKVKRGWLNWKFSFGLPGFTLDESFCASELSELMVQADLPGALRQEIKGLVPTLVNRYSRKYFRSADKAFRVTIDSELAYYLIGDSGGPRLKRGWSPGVGVLELKYAEEEDGRAHRITQGFPYRLTRSSKYVSGIDLTREQPGGDFWKMASVRRRDLAAPG